MMMIPSGPGLPDERVDMHTFQAMNTTFHTSGLSGQGEHDAESWFAFVENHLSRFRPDSELNRLNRSAGSPFLASPLLFQAISQSDYYFRHTKGLFHPFQGQLLTERGYDRSFEQLAGHRRHLAIHEVPAHKDSSAKRRMPDCPADDMGCGALFEEGDKDLEGVQLNAALRSIILPPGWSADLGGIAKGWSAEQFADLQ
jgi:FAD:protein FMN transferase